MKVVFALTAFVALAASADERVDPHAAVRAALEQGATLPRDPPAMPSRSPPPKMQKPRELPVDLRGAANQAALEAAKANAPAIADEALERAAGASARTAAPVPNAALDAQAAAAKSRVLTTRPQTPTRPAPPVNERPPRP